MGTVRCLCCGKILVSKHRHDFVQCNCENETFVDGGNDYMRAGGMDLALIEVLEDATNKEETP